MKLGLIWVLFFSSILISCQGRKTTNQSTLGSSSPNSSANSNQSGQVAVENAVPVPALPKTESDLLRIDTPPHLLFSQAKGGILIAGGTSGKAFLIRMTPQGLRDSTFDQALGDGPDFPVYAAGEYSDGSLLLGGDFSIIGKQSAAHIAKLDSNGALDLKFTETTGRGFNGRVSAIEILGDQSAIVAGDFTDFNGTQVIRIAHLFPDGTLDQKYGAEVSVTPAEIPVEAPTVKEMKDAEEQEKSESDDESKNGSKDIKNPKESEKKKPEKKEPKIKESVPVKPKETKHTSKGNSEGKKEKTGEDE